MNAPYIHLTKENLAQEHLCCAIADQKHQAGVAHKRKWLESQLDHGHVFRKLQVKGKVFIEYAPLESAWVPVYGTGYIYIYCLWVAGAYKNHGYAKALLEDCIAEAKAKGKAGICVLSSRKKKPFLSDKAFFIKHGFEVVDRVADDYELLALSFNGDKPHFSDTARRMTIPEQTMTIFYSPQCPYILNCIEEISGYCQQHHIPLQQCPVDSLEKAKQMPCVFNNWAVFYKGQFVTTHLLNEKSFVKMFGFKQEA